ncbi:hypothetical protein NECID01_2050 [Nematocida sp. AWRm77]|nr:hypothetical protein NECID01_2050 [Nematocida sp. AWRm77]
MNKIAAYLALCTLAMLCLCTDIEVKFNLASKEKAGICRLPKGMFRTIDNLEAHHSVLGKKEQTSSNPKEEYKIITLPNISTLQEYEHFKAFWETDLAALPAEDEVLSQYQEDLTPDLFDSFLFTAAFLEIRGEYANRFAKNMARYGLLGKHSKDIADLSQYMDKALPYDIFWILLYGFLRQADFGYRTIVHPTTGQTLLWIESITAEFNQIDEEYTGPSQETKIRTVLYSELGPASSPERERNEELLVWLLLNMGGSSVDIQYSSYIGSSEKIADLRQTIQNLTKENEKGACVYVEGISVDIGYISNLSLVLALQLVPNLSCLEISTICNYSDISDMYCFVTRISSCKSLKVLTIVNHPLNSMKISILVESLPGIEQLSFPCDILDSSAIDSLKECTQLESLKIWKAFQPSVSVQALLTHLPFLKELAIWCEPLEPAAAKAFQGCKKLEKLDICGKNQPTSALQALLRHLPSLKDLTIWCEPLEPAAVENFKTCAKLEKLKIRGEIQSSPAIQALLTRLPSLKELTILCEPLEPAAAKAFQGCEKLEKLKIRGEKQSSPAIQALLTHLPSLKEIEIRIDTADLALANALRKCPNLCIMVLKVWKYTPGFIVYYLETSLSKVEYLLLYNYDINNNYSKEDKRVQEEALCKNVYISLIGLWY